MPWCPKCKNEYIEGITTCADCGVELVEELHKAGYLVDGSVVNTKERLEAALALNVDMIESDHPEMILEFYRELTGKGGGGQ